MKQVKRIEVEVFDSRSGRYLGKYRMDAVEHHRYVRDVAGSEGHVDPLTYGIETVGARSVYIR